ncbi:MAG: capsule assembly Wzi family protein, partial [Terracidiphilus sp.]
MAVVLWCATLLAGISLFTASPIAGAQQGVAPACLPGALGSPYIPVDSWVYPAVMRLYSLGFVDNVFLGMRPWTRASVGHMIEEAADRIQDADAYGEPTVSEAQGIYEALMHELRDDQEGPCLEHQGYSRVESTYTVARGISGTPLRDSFHLGSTVINDYGRPYENGFNSYSGASGYATAGRFVLYLRGEFEAAPSAIGYPLALAQELSSIDGTTYTDPTTHLTNYFLPQATIPMGPIGTTTNGRVMEAFISAHVLDHEISLGKQDEWLGPGMGGGMAYSNNAENIYSFRINRIEPL